MLSDVDISDDPVRVILPLDLDRMGSWTCKVLDRLCWYVELRDGAVCRRCGSRAPKGIAAVLPFTRER